MNKTNFRVVIPTKVGIYLSYRKASFAYINNYLYRSPIKSGMTIVILIILLIGIFYRLALTADGNFLFNMDNARDMVDVREMVVLGKPRLIGPTSAIEGFYNGPAWYYLLAIPFILSGGDPYASILMEIALWAVGGFFLLKLVSRWGSFLVIPIGSLWVASNYIVLTNLYAFNPNPVTLLSPIFIYLLVEYLEKGRAVSGILAWILGGLFFNFEMNFGVFIPLIIVTGMLLTKKHKLFFKKIFWLGLGGFILTLLPQVLFDLRHQFIMSRSVLRHLSESSANAFNLLDRFQVISAGFYNSFLATLLNQKNLTLIFLLLFIPLIFWFVKERKKATVVYVSLILIFIPFLGYLFLPVTVNSWHLGGEMAVSLIPIAYLFKKLSEKGILGKMLYLSLAISLTWFSLFAVGNFFINEQGKKNSDPSLYKNEISAIDYVYQYANGKNFKVYTFMPSIYDYPYQYLFWWYGRKKYGYIPGEYAYAPNKPPYIPSQDKFQGIKKDLSGLVFLIKEPNRGYNWKSGWEADYRFMELLSSEKLGSIELEVRRE